MVGGHSVAYKLLYIHNSNVMLRRKRADGRALTGKPLADDGHADAGGG